MTRQGSSSTRSGFRRKVAAAAVVAGALAVPFAGFASADHGNDKGNSNRNSTHLQVTVRSSGLTFDSIIAADLPVRGPFQQLFPQGSGVPLETEFGPGDQGFVGGRWWIDTQPVDEAGHGVMDEDDLFFLCPLLGPGYYAA